MAEPYEGDGYEFSMRLQNYQRLRVHVTKAALAVLNEDQALADQFGVLAAHMSLLCQLARQCHDQNGDDYIVIGAADLVNKGGVAQTTNKA
jgi:hypothetical protein